MWSDSAEGWQRPKEQSLDVSRLTEAVKSGGPRQASTMVGSTLAVALDPEWLEVARADGTETYYWNKVTDTTTWARPAILGPGAAGAPCSEGRVASQADRIALQAGETAAQSALLRADRHRRLGAGSPGEVMASAFVSAATRGMPYGRVAGPDPPAGREQAATDPPHTPLMFRGPTDGGETTTADVIQRAESPSATDEGVTSAAASPQNLRDGEERSQSKPSDSAADGAVAGDGSNRSSSTISLLGNLSSSSLLGSVKSFRRVHADTAARENPFPSTRIPIATRQIGPVNGAFRPTPPSAPASDGAVRLDNNPRPAERRARLGFTAAAVEPERGHAVSDRGRSESTDEIGASSPAVGQAAGGVETITAGRSSLSARLSSCGQSTFGGHDHVPPPLGTPFGGGARPQRGAAGAAVEFAVGFAASADGLGENLASRGGSVEQQPVFGRAAPPACSSDRSISNDNISYDISYDISYGAHHGADPNAGQLPHPTATGAAKPRCPAAAATAIQRRYRQYVCDRPHHAGLVTQETEASRVPAVGHARSTICDSNDEIDDEISKVQWECSPSVLCVCVSVCRCLFSLSVCLSFCLFLRLVAEATRPRLFKATGRSLTLRSVCCRCLRRLHGCAWSWKEQSVKVEQSKCCCQWT